MPRNWLSRQIQHIPGLKTAHNYLGDKLDAGESERRQGDRATERARGEIEGLRDEMPSYLDTPEGRAELERLGQGLSPQEYALLKTRLEARPAEYTPTTLSDLLEDYGTPDTVGDKLSDGYDVSRTPDSGMRNVNADPNSIAAQNEALQGFRDIAHQGGLTAIDRARMEQERQAQEQWLRGQRGATLRNMQQRGLGGSGAELASIFDSEQNAANRNAAGDLNTEALAQQRAMDALGMTGSMGATIRGQSFDEGARRAQAQDIINRENAQMTTDRNRYGADVRNQGVYTDVGNTNTTRNANTDIHNTGHTFDVNNANDAEKYGIDQGWQRFGANQGIAGALAGIDTGTANRLYGESQGEQEFFGKAAGAGIDTLTGQAPGAGAGSTIFGGGGRPPAATYQPPPAVSRQPLNTTPDDDGLIDPWD